MEKKITNKLLEHHKIWRFKVKVRRRRSSRRIRIIWLSIFIILAGCCCIFQVYSSIWGVSGLTISMPTSIKLPTIQPPGTHEGQEPGQPHPDFQGELNQQKLEEKNPGIGKEKKHSSCRKK
ncbi:hypothetical protein PZ892_16395 [Sphingobacterium sp. WM]|uniref:hypothetical protein n=1 Tax=Sphingobacterium sp. WM TaxID=3031802 RepID=UPI00240E4214|nr:hypothetical protein [Sphingobacterium sp. WM]WFB63240.1 hypothetical protein PZ892_16395 [Sphingobacterium sp. WM]